MSRTAEMGAAEGKGTGLVRDKFYNGFPLTTRWNIFANVIFINGEAMGRIPTRKYQSDPFPLTDTDTRWLIFETLCFNPDNARSIFIHSVYVC